MHLDYFTRKIKLRIWHNSALSFTSVVVLSKLKLVATRFARGNNSNLM